MNAANEVEQDHGQANAAGWASTIAEYVAALEVDYERLEELRDERAGLEETFKQANAEYIENKDSGPDEAQARNDAADALTEWDEENGDELKELTDAATYEGDLQTDADSVRERIQECPLSVEVRNGWYAPGSDGDDVKPEEFMILLSTGGPALRIMGELGEHGGPTRAWLEYQDWGTPWTHHYVEGFSDTLLTFCQQFYFGE